MRSRLDVTSVSFMQIYIIIRMKYFDKGHRGNLDYV